MRKEIGILIAEDNEKHLQDAQKSVGNLKDSGAPIRPDYVIDKDSSIERISLGTYDGVISDIFMPSNSSGVSQEDRVICIDELLKGSEWKRGLPLYEKLPPLGILVAKSAKEAGMPVIFCTDSYHHNHDIEPVHHYAGKRRITLVDIYNDETKQGKTSDAKNWDEALVHLISGCVLRQEKDKIKRPGEYTRDEEKSMINYIASKLEEIGIYAKDINYPGTMYPHNEVKNAIERE